MEKNLYKKEQNNNYLIDELEAYIDEKDYQNLARAVNEAHFKPFLLQALEHATYAEYVDVKAIEVLWEPLALDQQRIQGFLEESIETNNTFFFDFLLNKNIDINDQENPAKFSPLMLAVEHNRFEMVQKLLSLSAKLGMMHRVLSAQDNKKNTAFIMAIYRNQTKNVDTFLQYSLNVYIPSDLQRGFYITAEYGQLEMMKALIKNPVVDMNKTNNFGDTALKIATLCNHASIVDCLLTQRVNVSTQELQTVTQAAVEQNQTVKGNAIQENIKILKLLINQGGIVDITQLSDSTRSAINHFQAELKQVYRGAKDRQPENFKPLYRFKP